MVRISEIEQLTNVLVFALWLNGKRPYFNLNLLSYFEYFCKTDGGKILRYVARMVYMYNSHTDRSFVIKLKIPMIMKLLQPRNHPSMIAFTTYKFK